MILVTGFEPFTTGQGLVLTHNPTADIATRVAERIEGVESAVLPVSFQDTKKSLTAHFERLKPSAWLGMGYAPHRTTLDIETIALNLEHAETGDNDGDTPWMRPIVKDAPLAYRTRLDERRAIEVFATHGVEAKAAIHAGAFLCNQSFFLGCHFAETSEFLKLAGFIHVPPMSDFGGFEEGLSALLREFAAA